MSDYKCHLTKAELEYYVNAKPRVVREVGYFKDGKFLDFPYYVAHLGNKRVGNADSGSYMAHVGGYSFRDQALEGAKQFQAKMRELLDAGNYSTPAKKPIPVKGIKVDPKTGKVTRVHSFDASKQRRIAGSKKQRAVSPAKAGRT